MAATPTDIDFPLGPIGGSFRITTGDNFLRITSVEDGAPGAIAGLQVDDFVYGTDGVPFRPTGSDFQGATRELGWAIGKAQATDGILSLNVLRPGTGEVTLDIDLGTAGGFSPAYPLSSPTFSAVAEKSLTELNQRLIDGGNIGYTTGWAAMALLASPHWDETTGATPYRLGVDKAYLYYKDLIERAQYSPVEQRLFDGTDNPNYDDSTAIYLENWYLGLGTMFLAEYYAKTLQDPPTPQNMANLALLQQAAEKCANRIQWWRQPQTRNAKQYYTSLRPGIVGHGNVSGDYMHYTWGGGINIVGVHLSGGLAMAKHAGVDMSVRPIDGRYFGYDPLLFDDDPTNDPVGESLPAGLTIDRTNNTVRVRIAVAMDGTETYEDLQFLPTAASHPDIPNVATFLAQQPTLDDKLDIIWDYYKRSQSPDTGHMNYLIDSGGLGDSGGRTPGVLFTTLQMQEASGVPFTGTNLERFTLLKSYHATQYDRHLNAHAMNTVGPAFYALSASTFSGRERRHFMDNWRFFYQLTRQPDDSTEFFRGRQYGGAGERAHADEIYFALAQGVAAGGLELVDGYDTSEAIIADWSKVPHLTWENLERRVIRTTATSVTLDLEATTGAGVGTTADSVLWTTASVATFSNAGSLDTTITAPRPGIYDVELQLTKNGNTIIDPLRLEVLPTIDTARYDQGFANQAVYNSISGGQIANLLAAAKFPDSPDSTRQVAGLTAEISGNSLGATLTTTIVPHETGAYRFYVAADDSASLLFNSTGADPADAIEIASHTAWTSPGQWDKYASQRSAEIQLIAGQHYYLEARMVEGGGGQHLSVGWTTPSSTDIEVIPSGNLAAPKNFAVPAFITQPANQTLALGDTLSLTPTIAGSAPAVFQWKFNGENYGLPLTTPELTIRNASAYVEGSWQLVYTSGSTVLTSEVAAVTLSDVGAIIDGGLWKETYNDISGGSISELTSHAKYLSAPDSSEAITSTTFAAGEENVDSYGQRWTGWIIPSETANYRFYAAADDQLQIHFSESEFACHKQQILYQTSYTSARNYDARSPSDWFHLEAGKRYFIEVLHKEGGGGDHAAITWQKEGDPTPADGSDGIPAANLQYRRGGADLNEACPPLARRDTLTAVAGQLVEIPVLANDFVKSPATLSITSISQPTIGVASISPDGQSLRLFPPVGVTGQTTLTYTIADSTGLSSVGAVIMDISSLGHGLQLHYDFEDTSGNTARDVSGNTYDGGFNGSVTDTADTTFGNTVTLDASADSIAVDPAVLDALTTSGTVSYWAKASSYSSVYTTMMLASDAEGDRILRWHYPWSSQAIMDWGDGEDYDRVLRYSGLDSADLIDEWTHVVLTKDGASGNLRIYVDGQLIASTSNKNRSIGSATSFRLGGSGFRGQLDELRIYDRALSPAEITALHQLPTRPSVTLSADASTVAETSSSPVTYTLSRSGNDLSAALPVNLAISGTATAGADYSAISATITMPADSNSQTFTLTPIDDAVAENTESVIIQILPDPAYTIGSADASLSITSDDAISVPMTSMDLTANTVTFHAPAGQEVGWATPQWSTSLAIDDWHDMTDQPMRMTGQPQTLDLPPAAQGQTKLFWRWKVE